MGQESQPCPVCGEEILAVAKKCKHCGEILDEALSAARASAKNEDMRKVAKWQKGIILCILAYFCLVAGQFAVPEDVRPFLGLGALPVILAGAVFTFLLSLEVYSPAVGVVLAIFTLVPCLGLIGLLIINSKATSLMKERGIQVGLLGANLSEI